MPTVATITHSPGGYNLAPAAHHHFSASTSTVNSGTLRDAQWEWWLQKADSTVVASSFGGPEFSWVLEEAGDYICTLRLKGLGDGASTDDQVEFSVGAETYSDEVYYDPSWGGTESGTESEPYATLAAAHSGLAAAAGAGTQRAIHCAAGQTETLSAGLGFTSSAGRLVFKKWGTGDNLVWDLNGADIQVYRTDDDAAMCLIGVDINGDASSPSFPATAGTTTPLRSDSDEANASGHNFIALNCAFSNMRDACYFSDSGTLTSAYLSGGAGDHIAFHNCTFTDGRDHILTERVRYVHLVTSHGRSGGTFAIRLGTWQHIFVRQTTTAQNGATIPLRLHSASANGIDSDFGVVERSYFLNRVWWQPDDGNGSAEEIHNLWSSANVFEGASGQNVAADFFINDGFVCRNCVFINRNNGVPVVGSRNTPIGAVGTSTNWLIENNTFIHTWNTGGGGLGNAGWTFNRFSGTVNTGVTFRNNLLVMPSLPSGTITFIQAGNGTPTAASVFDACNGNRLIIAAGTPNWASGWSAGNGDLGTWQGTGFDAASAAGTGTDPLTDSTGSPVDATLVTSSSPIDSGIATNLYLDKDGQIRTGTMDQGADSFGDTGTPTAPVFGSPPDDPSDLVLTPTHNSILVEWTDNADDETAYEVDYKLATEPTTWTVWADDLAPNTESTTITGLDAETEYDVRVRAVNADGESNYIADSATTEAAPEPGSAAVTRSSLSLGLRLGL